MSWHYKKYFKWFLCWNEWLDEKCREKQSHNNDGFKQPADKKASIKQKTISHFAESVSIH